MSTDAGTGGTQIPTSTGSIGRIPEVKVVEKGPSERERNQIEKDGSQSHRIRRWAAYGGIGFAFVLYVAGLFAIGLFLGLFPGCHKGADPAMWHIVIAVLVPLFTVPTVLLIAILRTSTPSPNTELPASSHEALGKWIEKVVDKIGGN